MSLSSRDGEYLTIPALGRTASLGYLYDQRRDEFKTSIFRRKLLDDDEAITTLDAHATDLDYTMANSYDEKFRFFNIEASIKANILSGMLTVEGSASYLQDEKETAHEVVGLMHYKCKTVDQTLELNYDRLKDFFNTKELSLSGATHIVSGIKWGANVTIKFSDTIDNKTDHQKICGELQIEFEKLKTFQISASAKVDIDGNDNSKEIKYNVSVRGNIVIGTVPSTYSQVMELISQVSELAKTANNGKGVPIEFKLSPLGPLREHLKHTANQNEFCEKVDDSLLNNFVMTFDDISYAEQNLNDTYKYLIENEICVSHANRTKIIELRGGFMNSKTVFTTSFKDTLVQVRSGNKPHSAFADLTKAYKDDEFGAYKIEQKLGEFHNAIKKVDFFKAIQKSNPEIKYFGLNGNLDSNFLRNTKDVVYILFTKPEFTQNDPSKYDECTHLFLTKLEKPFNQRYVVDCDFDYPLASSLSRTVIQQRVNGKISFEDVNEAIKKTRPFHILKMRALGRVAQVGQLYDAREDAFLDENFLKEGYKESSIIKVNPVESEDTPAIPSENILDKFDALGVEPELQFNILAEISPLVRTGIYFKGRTEQCDSHSKKADQDATRSFVYIMRLKDEEIKVKENDPNFWEALSIQAVSHGATHFVTKIEYGFSFIFSVHIPKAQQLPFKNAHKLNNYVTTLKKVISRIQIDGVKNQLVQMEELDGLSEDLNVTIYSDLQGLKSKPEILESKEELLNFFNNKFISKLSKRKKGVPIGYELYPIENLASMGLLSPHIPYGLLSQEGHDPSEFVNVLDDIDRARVQIQGMYDIFKVNKFATDEDTTALERIEAEFNSKLSSYKTQFQRVITEIKAGKKTSDEFRNLLGEFKVQKFFRKKQQYIPTDDLKLILKEREENAKKEAEKNKDTSLKEVNILLLSETGAGKTTWINAVANYLKYDTLDDALTAWTVQPTVIIPSKFTMTDSNYKEIIVGIGDTDSNEVYEEGQSSTQHATTYTFTTKEFLLRIIDTPGVGDTRGIDVDRINIQNTMSHISNSNVDVLHGICVLLKPNNSRLSTFFEGCITKILSQLHPDSTPNITFCFTNTRSTFYCPGESLSVLRTLLKVKNNDYSLIPLEKGTIYCLDNEAFRLLAAVQQGQVFEDSFKGGFKESWNASVLETKRLLANFQMAQPEEVNKMVMLHTAREALLQLGNPLANISVNAQSEKSEKRRQQFESEVKEIIKTCAGLTAFVHANSLTHFNSSILRCLDSLIEAEGLKVSFGGGATTLDQLKKTRMAYQAEENARLSALKQPRGFRMTREHARQLIEDLYELPLSGDNIRKLLEMSAAGPGNLPYIEKSFTII